MINFLKNFGLGLLYVILLPVFLVGLVLFAIFGIFTFIFQMIKCLINFFSGNTLFPSNEIDDQIVQIRDARFQKLNALEETSSEPQVTTTNNTDNSSSVVNNYIQQNYYQNPNEAPAPFPAPQTSEPVNAIEDEDEELTALLTSDAVDEPPSPDIPQIEEGHQEPTYEETEEGELVEIEEEDEI